MRIWICGVWISCASLWVGRRVGHVVGGRGWDLVAARARAFASSSSLWDREAVQDVVRLRDALRHVSASWGCRWGVRCPSCASCSSSPCLALVLLPSASWPLRFQHARPPAPAPDFTGLAFSTVQCSVGVVWWVKLRTSEHVSRS